MNKVILSFILGLTSLAAQGIKQFKHLNLEQGLSGTSIECFCQDSRGFIWVGSNNGLNRFDGYRFTNYFYNKTDSNSLQNNEILSLLEDSHHTIWVGTGSGLQCYNQTTDNFYTIPFTKKAFPVRTLLEDKKGNLWIGTLGAGLCLYSIALKHIETCTFEPLKYKSINTLYEDKQGNVWVGTENSGIYLIDRNSGNICDIKSKFNLSASGIGDEKIRVSAFAEDARGNIWISLYGNGIFLIDVKNNLVKSFTPNTQSDFSLCSQILCDADNNVWMAFDGAGLYSYNIVSKNVDSYQHKADEPYSISSNAVRTLFADNQNNLWIGTYNAGVNLKKLKTNSQFKLLHQQTNAWHSIPCNNVTGIVKDKFGFVWITTDGGGLCRYNPVNGEVKTIHPAPFNNLIYSNALCVTTDLKGTIWAGFYRGGFISINPENLTIKQYFDDETSISQTGVTNDIRTINSDKNGNLWIGTNGQGLLYFNPEKGIIKRLVKDYSNIKPGLTGNYIRSVLEDSKGYIWIGSTYGLTRYNPKKNSYLNFFEDRSNPKSLISNCIFGIYENSDGYIYIATTEGLSILETAVWTKEYDNETVAGKSFSFKNFTVLQGLPDKTLYSILEDKNRNIWMGTGKGLAAFNPKNNTFRNYSVDERLTDVFNTGACFKSADDKFYFGTVKGLVSFFPDSIKELSNTHNTLITNVNINFESLFKTPKKAESLFNDNIIELNYGEKSVNIEFSALEMFLSDEIKYQYKLDGFDKEWNTVEANQRVATYTNLNPGTYNFLLKSTNANGIWNQSSNSTTIIVKPPFWRSWWFIVLIFVMLFSILYTTYLARIRAISQRNLKLEKLVSERSEELLKERELQKHLELEHNSALLKQKELESNQLKAEKELIQLKNEKLQYDIERQTVEMEKKNSELVSMAVQTTQKLEFLAKLKQSLIDILSKTNADSQTLINALIKQIDKDTDIKKDWEHFEQHFNQANNNFFKTLKERFPELTPLDLRMCAYLRMNLSNKEIASLQSISLRGVEKSRSRLRKKLNLENDENIIEFLISIS